MSKHLRYAFNSYQFIIRRHASTTPGFGLISTPPPFVPTANIEEKPLEKKLTPDEWQRKRRTDWKRKQGGEAFLDHVIITVRAGNGGDGCVAFHREKFQEYGPPAGGNGGRGGDVHILPSTHLTTLASVQKRVRGNHGMNGHGSWLNGRNGAPLIIRVPVGTIVRELTGDDPRRAKDEWEAQEESMVDLSPDDREQALRDRRFVHFPRYAGENMKRDVFHAAEQIALKDELEMRIARKRRALQPLRLDLAVAEDEEIDPAAPLGVATPARYGHLVASGGRGGMGNPHFLGPQSRSPKFATRGHLGERVTLELELKLLADVALVGFPNAGKSTLLRALTGGRARTAVAGYAFTTLNPVVAVVRVAADGAYEGESGLVTHEETLDEERAARALQDSGAFADTLTRNARDDEAGHAFDLREDFRFTIADNPGLVERASENVGLGHAFLRSIERSLALTYVVDLAGPAPWEELRVLKDELEKYKPGMSRRARMVLANKADLLVDVTTGNEEQVREAQEKLAKLEEYVRTQMNIPAADGEEARTLDVVPVSAKYSQNLRKVVALMRTYVEAARPVPDVQA